MGLAIASPHFLTETNLSSVVRQTAVINIMSLGMTIIIIAGGIDLSVGAILAMSGVLGAMAMEKGMPIPVGMLIGILAGLFCGFVNGILTTRLRIEPFIVTLGTLGIIRGLTLIVTNGLPVHGVPQGFSFLGEGNLFGVPFVLWVLVVCAVLTHVILEHTRLGRYAYAIGSNTDAAVYAGVPVGFDTTTVYALGGMLTGLAGMIEASRLMTGQPAAGQWLRIAGHRRGGDRRRQFARRRRQRHRHPDRRVHHGAALERQRPAGCIALLAAGDHRRGDYPGGNGGRTAEAAPGIAPSRSA